MRQTGEPIQVLKNGKPLVVVTAAPVPVDRKNSFGYMKHTLTGPLGDVLSPVIDESEWEVLR